MRTGASWGFEDWSFCGFRTGASVDLVIAGFFPTGFFVHAFEI